MIHNSHHAEIFSTLLLIRLAPSLFRQEKNGKGKGKGKGKSEIGEKGKSFVVHSIRQTFQADLLQMTK